MPLSNLALDNVTTFQTWVTLTNQIVTLLNDFTNGNLVVSGLVTFNGSGTTLIVANNALINGTLFLANTRGGEALNISAGIININVPTTNLTSNLTVNGVIQFNPSINVGTQVGSNGYTSYEPLVGRFAGNAFVAGAIARSQANQSSGYTLDHWDDSGLYINGNVTAQKNIVATGNISTSQYFSGNGALLSSLNASALTSGVIPTATLIASQVAYGSVGNTTLYISDTAPASPNSNNSLWWQSNTGFLKIYYNDGSSAQWVDSIPLWWNTSIANTANAAYAQANAAYAKANSGTTPIEYALIDAASISWDVQANGPAANVTLGGNRILANATNLQPGATYTLRVINPLNYTLGLQNQGKMYKVTANVTPVPTSNAISIWTFYSDGRNMYIVPSFNFPN